MRNGIKDSTCWFRLAHFRRVTALSEVVVRHHLANLFPEVCQFRFCMEGERSLDLTLCLNGTPNLTDKLTKPLTGQTVNEPV